MEIDDVEKSALSIYTRIYIRSTYKNNHNFLSLRQAMLLL